MVSAASDSETSFPLHELHSRVLLAWFLYYCLMNILRIARMALLTIRF
jgi:hypothetical protein